MKTQRSVLTKISWVIPAVLLLCCVSEVYGLEDEITTEEGEEITGKIQGETFSTIKIKTDSGTRKIARRNIQHVSYHDAVLEKVQAKEAVQKRHGAEAIQQARKALKLISQGELRTLHKPRLQFYLAAGHYLEGDFNYVQEKLPSLLEEKLDQTVFIPAARIWLLSKINLSLQDDGKIGDRSQLLNVVQNRVADLNDWLLEKDATEEIRQHMALLEAFMLEDIGRPEFAMNVYESLGNRVRHSSLRKHIRAGKARVYYARLSDSNRNQEELLESVQALQTNYEDQEQKNGGRSDWQMLQIQGIASVIEARSNDDRSKYREAILSMIRSSAYWSPGFEESSYPHRWTLAICGKLYEKLAETGENKKEKTYFLDQARKTNLEVRELYPYTSQGFQARKRLQSNAFQLDS